MDDPREMTERVFRTETPRIVATLIRRIGDIDLADDATQEALALALQRWPQDGIPANPGAWIYTVARNRALDLLRRRRVLASVSIEDALNEVEQQLCSESASDEAERALLEDADIPDERLALIFTCCHPALSDESQVVLTLRLVAGLTPGEIASAFLLPQPTIAQRLTRAKKKIREAGIPFGVPSSGEREARLNAVLAVIYLVFNEGYAASGGPELVRASLCEEAIRLGRVLVELSPNSAEALALLALMRLTDSRRAARTSAEGELILLDEQDRKRWDAGAITESLELLQLSQLLDRPGPYQLQAAIAAVHARAAEPKETNWREIVRLYDELLRLYPTPIIALNRAAAIAMAEGPAAGLVLIEALAPSTALERYPYYHSIRAELLRRLERNDEARHAYELALRSCANDSSRRWLQRRRDELG